MSSTINDDPKSKCAIAHNVNILYWIYRLLEVLCPILIGEPFNYNELITGASPIHFPVVTLFILSKP